MSLTSADDDRPKGAPTNYADRRAAPRAKALLRGIIYYNDRSAAADCLVRDISATGAKLELSENVIIPDLIDIYISKKGETLRAAVQWRRGDLVGIAFMGPAKTKDIEKPSATSAGASVAERVEYLEGEVASLRRSMKALLDRQVALPGMRERF